MDRMNRRHLEDLIGISRVHLQTFDGHGGSHVVAIAHFCKSTVVISLPNTDKIPLDDVRGGDNRAGFTDFGKKQ